MRANRKIAIGIVIIATFLMIIGVVSNLKAAAQEGYVDETVDAFYGTTEVTYREYSSFYVTIPATIPYGGTGDITVNMSNVESGYHVSVYITNLDENGMLTVSSENGNTGKLSVLHDNGMYNVDATGLVTSFYPESYNGDATTNISVMSSGMRLKPGLYSGSISFRIACEINE